MTMTKKDYELVSEAIDNAESLISRECSNGYISESMRNLKLGGAREVMFQIADALELNNPRFNRERFIRASERRAK